MTPRPRPAPIVLALLALLAWGVRADEPQPPGESAAPAEQKQQAPVAPQQKAGPRIVPPEKLAEPVKSDVPLAPGAEEALQWKALSSNLLQNPSFEAGRYWPYAWDPVDNLGTFWAKGGTDGERCVRCCTDVLDKQWVEWNDKVILIVREATKRAGGEPQGLSSNPMPPPPLRAPTTPPYYDTVAGLHGIHYRSAFVGIEPGAIYRLSLDARTDAGTPKVFVKGFIDQTRKTDQGVQVLKRNAYRAEATLYGCSGEWRRFSRVFHPARSKSTYKGRPIQPEWLRVELYASWPPGNYYFDNVRLEIIGYEGIQNSPGSQQEPKQQETVPPKRMEGGFPVF